METKVLKLRFTDAQEGSISLTIASPREDLDQAAIATAMTALIGTDAIAGAGGVITKAVAAEIVTTSVVSYSVA